MLRRQFVTGLLMTVVLTVLLGFVYPLVVTGISQVTMSKRANGSLVTAHGQVVGSSLIGQSFSAGINFFRLSRVGICSLSPCSTDDPRDGGYLPLNQ